MKYNDEAIKKKVYILSGCGLDSILADLGVPHLQKNFNGTVNSVEIFLLPHIMNNCKPSGVLGAYETALLVFAFVNRIKAAKRDLFQNQPFQLQPYLNDRGLHRSKEVDNRWCLPISHLDRDLKLGSQDLFFENRLKRPVQVRTFITFNSIIHVMLTFFFTFIFKLFYNFSFGEKLSKFFNHDGSTKKLEENILLEMIFVGKGWKEKDFDPNYQFTKPMNKKLVTRVLLPNHGYESSCIGALAAATVILSESSNKPVRGGVLSPASTFSKPNLINMLHKIGLKFEVIKEVERTKRYCRSG